MVDVKSLVYFGATLANNGVNCSSGKRLLSSSTIHAVVPLMTTCGMYNNAGKFAKNWGVPAKSGVSGGLLCIIPNLGA